MHNASKCIGSQTVLGGEMLEGVAIEAVEAVAKGGNIQAPHGVFSKEGFVGNDDAVLAGKCTELAAIVAGDPTAEIAEPDIPLGVFVDVVDDIVEQAVGGTEGGESMAIIARHATAVGAKPQKSPPVLANGHDLGLRQSVVNVEVCKIVLLRNQLRPKPNLHNKKQQKTVGSPKRFNCNSHPTKIDHKLSIQATSQSSLKGLLTFLVLWSVLCVNLEFF